MRLQRAHRVLAGRWYNAFSGPPRHPSPESSGAGSAEEIMDDGHSKAKLANDRDRIRQLNDALRRSFAGGRVMMTAGVNAKRDDARKLFAPGIAFSRREKLDKIESRERRQEYVPKMRLATLSKGWSSSRTGGRQRNERPNGKRRHRSPRFVVECRSARPAANQELNLLSCLSTGEVCGRTGSVTVLTPRSSGSSAM